MAQVRLGLEAHTGGLDATAALDPDLAGPVDHDLVDLGVGEQRLQRPEAERALGDETRQLGAIVLGQDRRLAIDHRTDALEQVSPAGARVRIREEARAQPVREPVEGLRAIERVHPQARSRRSRPRPPAGVGTPPKVEED